MTLFCPLDFSVVASVYLKSAVIKSAGVVPVRVEVEVVAASLQLQESHLKMANLS